MAKRSKFNYFDAFEKQVDIASEEAEVLIEAIEGFTTSDELKDILVRAHEIEHRGDEVHHEILSAVAVDFITPIEPGDILELAQDLDDVIDHIEGTIQRFYMYNVQDMPDKAMEFARIIKKSLKALRKSMEYFREFKKVKKINAMVEDVNKLEEQADDLYVETIRQLFTNSKDDFVHTEVWLRLFDRLEATCDDCKTVADTMSSIMLKNV